MVRNEIQISLLESTSPPFTKYKVSGSTLQEGANGEKTKLEANVLFRKVSLQHGDMQRSLEPQVWPLPITGDLQHHQSAFLCLSFPHLSKGKDNTCLSKILYEDHIIRAMKNLKNIFKPPKIQGIGLLYHYIPSHLVIPPIHCHSA